MYFYVIFTLVVIYFIGLFGARAALAEALVVLVHNPYFTKGSSEFAKLLSAMEAGRVVTRVEAFWQLVGVFVWPMVAVWLVGYLVWRKLVR